MRLIFWGNVIRRQGVEYYIHAPTGGGNATGPFNNEWQRIYDKNSDYLKNTTQKVSTSFEIAKINSWCQDTSKTFKGDYRIARAEGNIVSGKRSSTSAFWGYRPLLSFALVHNMSYPKDYTRTVTLKLNGGKLGTSGDDLKIAVKNVEVLIPTGAEITFTAPSNTGLSRPEGNSDSYFMWLGDDGSLYAPGDSVPSSVTTLTAKWSDHTNCVCGGKNEEESHNHSSVDWQPWTATDSLPTSSGNYFLVNNVILPAEQKMNADINLCFNGKTVSVVQYALSGGERLISIDAATPVTVTLTDCGAGGLLDATDAVSFGTTYLANAVSVSESNKLVIGGGVTINGEVLLKGNVEAHITDRASLKGDKASFKTYDNTKLFIEGNSEIKGAYIADKTKARISGEARVTGLFRVNNEAELVACDNVTINEIRWQNFVGSQTMSLLGKARVSGEFRITAYEDDVTIRLIMNDSAQVRGDLLLVGKGKNTKIILSGDRVDIGGSMEFVTLSSNCKNFTVEVENMAIIGTDINMPDVTLKGHFVCNGDIKDGIFDENGTVVNNGKITGGIFYGTVFGTATIEDSAKRTVSFETNGGSAIAPQKILRGQKATAPTAPIKVGYAFGNWTIGGAAFDFDATPIIDDIAVTATWTLCNHIGSTANPTCTKPATCTICAGTIAALGHAPKAGYKSSENSHWIECERCTEKLSEEPHSGTDDGDCTTAVKCGTCGHTIIAAKTAHAFGAWQATGNGTHIRSCTVSGCTAGIETEKCSGGKATCKNEAECDVCGKGYGGFDEANHAGEKATCKDKAVCDICGKGYGGLAPENHANLVHISARAATKDTDGNIEYWYCGGCGKYYGDAAATKEIAEADTIIKKLPDDEASTQTDNDGSPVLWAALLLIVGGTVVVSVVIIKKKKRSVK